MQARSILIVEDEARVAMMLADFPESLDLVVHAVASNVAEAQHFADQGGFHAALLDCNLQGEQSWDVARALAQQSIPFAFVTGGSVSDLPDDLSGSQTLEKPFTMDDVQRTVNALIGA